MATFNPQSRNLIVISVGLRKEGTPSQKVDYLFPLNPASLNINQASRVSATFTYGEKVFQNLGAGLKTISIEGHTGYRLDTRKYGLQKTSSNLAWASTFEDKYAGRKHWLDLYSVVQLIKGENKYIPEYTEISDSFSAENVDNIEYVKITIPDQSITYDVLLQNDSFMRNREQPHLYKYKLDFIVTGEAFGTANRIEVTADKDESVGGITAKLKKQADLLKSAKEFVYSIPGVQTVSDAYDTAVEAINEAVDWGNFFITSANSSINDLRRLERMTDALNGVAKTISLVRGTVNQIKSFSNLKTAFYEPYIRIKNIQSQLKLLKKSMTGEKESLAFNVNITRLASISAPVTLAANKATVAQFSTDIRKLSNITFPFPIDRVEEITTNDIRKINVFFKFQPSALGISDVRIFAINDFGRENNLVESFSDTGLVLSTSYGETGYLYNFVIEYNYTSFESIIQPRYKSIKRILITPGETIESMIKKYASVEANSSNTYLSEVAYLNNIEYPYIITSDNPVFDAYFGSYGHKIFENQNSFLQYVNNISTSPSPGPDLPLYDPSSLDMDDPSIFLLQEPNVIDLIKLYNRFFVVLLKETYSNRCYALFGMTNNLTCKLFDADSYAIVALRKGRTYDIENNAIFEILSPYSITGDLIEYYDQTVLFDSITDPEISLFDKEVTIIEEIYTQNVGSFTSVNQFPFSEDDKEFLSGDYENRNYVILTNFTATGSDVISSYTIQAFSEYSVLTDGQELLLPSLDEDFLSFSKVFAKEDTYKIDLDSRFQYFDDINVSILPRPDLGVGQGILDFKLVSGLENVKQAIKNRLECPQGGLILHLDYGLPLLLGKKNTLENLILLRYSLFSQLMSDLRVKAASNIRVEDKGDAVNAQASVILVNNDETIISTSV